MSLTTRPFDEQMQRVVDDSQKATVRAANAARYVAPTTPRLSKGWARIAVLLTAIMLMAFIVLAR